MSLRSRRFKLMAEEERADYTVMRVLYEAIPTYGSVRNHFLHYCDLFEHLVRCSDKLKIAIIYVPQLVDGIRHMVQKIRLERYVVFGERLHIDPRHCNALLTDVIYKIKPPLLQNYHHISSLEDPFWKRSLLELYLCAELVDYALLSWTST